MREVLRVTDQATAAIFASRTQRIIVQSLIASAATMGELSKTLPISLSLLHYHLSKCVDLGLVVVERIEPRSGRPLKYYRAAAKSFFVPSALLSEMPGSEMSRDLREALVKNQIRSVKGVHFAHDGRQAYLKYVKEPAMAATETELWLDIRLSSDDARELVTEMRALLERYGARDTEKQPRYLVHLAAARARSVR